MRGKKEAGEEMTVKSCYKVSDKRFSKLTDSKLFYKAMNTSINARKTSNKKPPYQLLYAFLCDIITLFKSVYY